MAIALKSLTKLIEIETGKEWRVERRTRGKDAESADPSRPTQTWIIILSNPMGHKQFVPEERIWKLFRPIDAPAAVAESATESTTVESV